MIVTDAAWSQRSREDNAVILSRVTLDRECDRSMASHMQSGEGVKNVRPILDRLKDVLRHVSPLSHYRWSGVKIVEAPRLCEHNNVSFLQR